MQQIINAFMNAKASGGNPQILAQQLIMNNPQAKQALEQMKNMAGGLSPREFAFQYAKQNGVSEQDLLNFARQFGLN